MQGGEPYEMTIRPNIANLESDKARYECPLPSCTAVLKGIGFFPSHLRKVHNIVINEVRSVEVGN
jgi:hypothetical protein